MVGASGRVWLGRGLLLAIGGAAGASAIIAPDSISNLVAYAWGGMGAAFGPVTILALYWRRFNFWGAMASIIVGAGVRDHLAFQFRRSVGDVRHGHRDGARLHRRQYPRASPPRS